MIARQRRMVFVGLILLGVGGASALALQALKENVTYFMTPSQMLADPKSGEKALRLGGMVKQGSVERAEGSMTVRFVATDFKQDVPVAYTGVLPDLFREGQGVIARGKFVSGVFQAEQVLAKHDEKYMPAELAEQLKQEHGGKLPTTKEQP